MSIPNWQSQQPAPKDASCKWYKMVSAPWLQQYQGPEHLCQDLQEGMSIIHSNSSLSNVYISLHKWTVCALIDDDEASTPEG